MIEFENISIDEITSRLGFPMSFKIDFAKRHISNEWIQYLNGNTVCEINKHDGTLIMTSMDDDFKLEFPVNIDMNISNRCNIECPFCYQNCTKNGKEANIKKFLKDKHSFFYTLHPGTELALNGNDPFHPQLIKLLKFCKKRLILANLTVNEKTLLKNMKLIKRLMKKRLINGLGVSPSLYSKEMLDFAAENSRVVVHTIAGITTAKQYVTLANHNIKILILGYKVFGKGISYRKDNPAISYNKKKLKEFLKAVGRDLRLVSFDNLAIEQLDPKSLLDLSDDEYELLFRGEDGGHTMFIDLVNETYAKNSIQLRRYHRTLTNDISDMFHNICVKLDNL